MQSISDQARALARNLNIGVIGVESPYDATLVEPARVTGVGDFSTTIDAIRFQATTHRLTEGSFPVNHPKNYLGYALALSADGDTADIYSEHVINSVSGGRRGAILLGLVDNRPDGELLTHLGAEVVRFGRAQHGTVAAALEEFAAWNALVNQIICSQGTLVVVPAWERPPVDVKTWLTIGISEGCSLPGTAPAE
ncbi:hypothetical protein [Haloferax profundi]|uniref:hypothetical protein n=1 Tax=Haloferax profundi TaxID=1544718 RepID=UPI000AF650F3|nr:hypothetical protein [Haloferax profundi]